MTYKYVAYTAQKKVVKGSLDVASESTAVETLERAGLRVLRLRRTRSWDVSRLLPTLYGVKTRDVILFTRQLAMLLERGAGFLTALRLSRDQVANRTLKRILTKVIEDVQAGSTFSAAAAKHPQVFKLAYTRMMMVGEETGKLAVVLREMATSMERDEATRKKVKGAMTYPVFILFLGLAVGIIMVTAVLPPLLRLFEDFGAQLPWTTRLLIAIMGFVTSYKFYLLGAVVLLVGLGVWYVRRPSGSYRLEKLLLRVPVIGRVSLLHSMFDFSRIMSTLLGAGLPMTEVMTIARQSVRSEVARRALGGIPKDLLQGRGLSQAMKSNPLFPGMLIQIVATGEETNSLDSSFAAVADHYESEFVDTLAALTAMLEPLLLIFVGLVVGFVAVSVIMPMYSIYNVLG